MKTEEVFESPHFTRAVQRGLEALFGEDWQTAELATLAVEEDMDRREALVATPLGLVKFAAEERMPAAFNDTKPIKITVVPWQETEKVQLSGAVYPTADEGPAAVVHWTLEGVEQRTITIRRTPEQLADFARAFLSQRARVRLA